MPWNPASLCTCKGRVVQSLPKTADFYTFLKHFYICNYKSNKSVCQLLRFKFNL